MRTKIEKIKLVTELVDELNLSAKELLVYWIENGQVDLNALVRPSTKTVAENEDQKIRKEVIL